MIDLFNFNDREHRKQEILSMAERTFDLFDEASVHAFNSLKEKFQNATTKSTQLNAKLSNYVEDNNGVPTSSDIEVLEEIIDLEADQYWTTEHLNALSEMKIVYLFKSLEITMKSLIHTAYPKINTKAFYQWDSMATYFKSIDIIISSFDGYVEITELCKVNNSIKHNNIITEEIKKIREFVNETEFTYSNIDLFHNRIKPKIEKFIKQLRQGIINDLFIFDDSRVEKIGNNFKLRMEDETLKKLADKLTDGQKP